ncbi:hypothetical protein NP493_246g01066 [Ridgeia piscesae]|uniref:Uncharacterized protein n=1 Tax=Ridgeia piscesae TaxID=27915 RepID=A0AAD9NYY1_RIDPI|nr:hypothetical protein NP493_246g01066 [Ridgeia piscesae]
MTHQSSDTELDDDVSSDVFTHLPQHDGCFAHTVQLVVKGTLRSVTGNASNIVSHNQPWEGASEEGCIEISGDNQEASKEKKAVMFAMEMPSDDDFTASNGWLQAPQCQVGGTVGRGSQGARGRGR